MTHKSIINELAMNFKTYSEILNSPVVDDIKVGFEFEFRPDMSEYSSGPDDYDDNEKFTSIDDIIEFFNRNNANPGFSLTRFKNKIRAEFFEWQRDKINNEIEGEIEEHADFTDYIDEKIDEYLEENNLLKTSDDFLNEAEEELGYLFNDKDAINKLAEEKADDYNREQREEMNDPRNDLYQTIKTEFVQKVLDEEDNEEILNWLDPNLNNYSEADFLYDRDYFSPTAVFYEFDLEWPFNNDLSDDFFEDVTNKFESAFNVPTVYNTSAKSQPRNDRDWIFEPDTSGGSDGDLLEIVSPPLSLKVAIELYPKIIEWAKSFGLDTDDTTGLHINVSTPDFDLAKLDYVKLVLMSGDEHVLQTFERMTNSYCRSALNLIQERQNRLAKHELVHVLDKFKSKLDDVATRLISRASTEKFISINVKNNRIEFRSAGSDYLNIEPKIVIGTVLRYSFALSVALDTEKYKQEYAKKLYKFISADLVGNDNIKEFAIVMSSNRRVRDLYLSNKRQNKKPKVNPTVHESNPLNIQNPNAIKWLIKYYEDFYLVPGTYYGTQAINALSKENAWNPVVMYLRGAVSPVQKTLFEINPKNSSLDYYFFACDDEDELAQLAKYELDLNRDDYNVVKLGNTVKDISDYKKSAPVQTRLPDKIRKWKISDFITDKNTEITASSKDMAIQYYLQQNKDADIDRLYIEEI